LWDIAQSGYTKPDNNGTVYKEEQKELEDFEQKNAQTLLVLQQVVGEIIARRIMDAKTTKGHGIFWKNNLKAMNRYVPLNYTI